MTPLLLYQSSEVPGPPGPGSFVLVRCAKAMSYEAIRDHLNKKGIPCPSGKGPWATGTIAEMLRDNRLEQYAGTAFWNKENHKEKGVRFNPRGEWTEVENAHPPLIDKDQLAALLARKAKARRNYRFAPASVSAYLFTGTALEGMPFFTCTACGGNMIGYRNGAERWYKYLCGSARSRGTAGCTYHTIIDKEWLESTVLSELEKRYQTPKRIKEIVASVQKNMNATADGYRQSMKQLTDKKQELVTQLQRLLHAVKAGMPPEVVIPETRKLSDEIAGIDDDLIKLRKAPPAATQIEEEAVEKFLSNFRTAYDAATWPERKQLVRTFIRNMEFDPEKREIRVHFYPDLAVQSICVGRGTRGLCNSLSRFS